MDFSDSRRTVECADEYMIYLLTASGLSPGGSTHLHTNNTENNTNNNRTTQITNNVEECGPCPVFASFTLAFALQLRKKARKNLIYIYINLIYSVYIWYIYIYHIKFCENPSSESRTVPCGRTDITQLTVADQSGVSKSSARRATKLFKIWPHKISPLKSVVPRLEIYRPMMQVVSRNAILRNSLI